jgi:hypothetical protein
MVASVSVILPVIAWAFVTIAAYRHLPKYWAAGVAFHPSDRNSSPRFLSRTSTCGEAHSVRSAGIDERRRFGDPYSGGWRPYYSGAGNGR